MHPKTHPNPSIIAKDAIRGIRFAMKRGAKMIVQNGSRQLPEQFETASSDFFQGAKKLTGTVDNIAKRVLGLEFDEEKFQVPSFATGHHQSEPQEQLSLDASNLYFALSLAAKHLGVEDLLVSEALCARLIAEGVSIELPPSELSKEALCVDLFKRLVATGVLGDPPGVESRHNSEHLEDVVTISFATALWLYVQRGTFGDTELEILQICSDVAAQMSGEIVKNRASDKELLSLFKYALDTV